MTQKELADSAEMKQSRISAMERPGEVQFNLETLVRLAAAFKVGLKVQFVPFSNMLDWENDFSQDQFNATPIDGDTRFLNPAMVAEVISLPTTVPISNVTTVARFNFTYGTQAVQTAIGEVWNSAPLAPVELVVAATASRIDVYSGANQDAN
jgi:transcriptional regulator with XRE-family HTH domain